MISVVIPTYKNKELFLKNLKNNLRYLTNCEIIVVNDDPDESLVKDFNELKNSKKFREQTKNLFLIENKENLGFAQTVNKGIKKAKGDYLMLLNSDVLLFNDSFKKGLNYFKNDPNLFGVSFAQIEKSGEIVGKNKIYWKKGLIFHQKVDDLEFGINGWLEGGACLLDKKKVDQLNGFNSIFSPFYWEDIDLSYRAYKVDYKIIFDPKIKVKHNHETTIKKYFTEERIKTIAYRNQLIFILININQFKFLLEFFLFFPYWLVFFLIKRELSFIRGFLNLFCFVPLIIKQRQEYKKLFKVKDEDIFKKFA